MAVAKKVPMGLFPFFEWFKSRSHIHFSVFFGNSREGNGIYSFAFNDCRALPSKSATLFFVPIFGKSASASSYP